MSAPTTVCEIKDGSFTTYELTPEQFGFTRCGKDGADGGSLRQDNAQIALGDCKWKRAGRKAGGGRAELRRCGAPYRKGHFKRRCGQGSAGNRAKAARRLHSWMQFAALTNQEQEDWKSFSIARFERAHLAASSTCATCVRRNRSGKHERADRILDTRADAAQEARVEENKKKERWRLLEQREQRNDLAAGTGFPLKRRWQARGMSVYLRGKKGIPIQRTHCSRTFRILEIAKAV